MKFMLPELKTTFYLHVNNIEEAINWILERHAFKESYIRENLVEVKS